MLLQRFGGISRYYYELMNKINERGLAHVDAYCLLSRNSYFESYFHKTPDIMQRLRGKRAMNRIVASHKFKWYDIVHPTYYDNYVLHQKGNFKIVITVYDMIHELFAGKLGPEDGGTTIENKKKMIYGSDHIIAISENTKKDILKFYPDIPENKISVIYIGSNMVNANISDLDNCFLPDKFILFVGQRGWYKNFFEFAKSIVPLLQEDKELHLVCIGGGAFTENEVNLFLDSDISGQVHQFGADNAHLAAAYQKAQCFVFPSLYEGFGIPTLEAFCCGCPVILSNTSSMPEVGGDAVAYIDPHDPRDMEQKVRMVLSDREMRMDMVKKGLDRVKMFDWNRIAEQTVECYRSVLNS